MVNFRLSSSSSVVASLLLLLLLQQNHCCDGHLTVSTHPNPLPKPLSDMTATHLTNTDQILILGGCDDPLGNTFVPSASLFVCNSISSKAYVFDISDGTFMEKTDMLSERSRHTALNVDGNIWVVGGRDGDGNLVPHIDVYDPTDDSWTRLDDQLPTKYQVSDHATFKDSTNNYVYITGGYDQYYETTYNTTYRFDTTTTPLTIEELTPLLDERGDIHAVNSPDLRYAYVTGGFTNTNNWCEPHYTVERYDTKNDVWITIAPLQTARADKALVNLNNMIYALGGETQFENKCQTNKVDFPKPEEQTVAVDDIEVYNPSEGASVAKWNVLFSMPEHRFRFAALGWDDSKTIYTFGGQMEFDESCNCFKTTDKVVKYTDHGDDHGDDGPSAKNDNTSGGGGGLRVVAKRGGTIMSVVVCVGVVFLLGLF